MSVVAPSLLYKYRPVDCFTERLITHNEIWFSRPAELNDPFDCKLHISAVGTEADRRNYLRAIRPVLAENQIAAELIRLGDPSAVGSIENDINETIQTTVRDLGIFCMSARNDDLRMWTDYANGHQGICAEFQTHDGKLFGCELTEVAYEEQHPNVTMFDGCDRKWAERTLSTKRAAYRNEAEWRILYHTPGVQVFPPEELTRLILGCRTSARDKAQVMKWVAARRVPLQIYEARPRCGSFTLDIVPAFEPLPQS